MNEAKTSDLLKIRTTALNMLAIREHTEQEIRYKLQAKGFSVPDIQKVIADLVQQNLLSNHRFIEVYIHSRQRRGYGPVRIRNELEERGVSQELIAQYLNITDNAWLNNVREVWQKRFKGQLPLDYKMRAQQIRFLQYRGFTLNQINCIFQSDD